MIRKRQTWLTWEEWEWIKAMRNARVCAEKRPFESKGEALRSAVTLMCKTDTTAPKLYAYRCPTCDKWHLTKKKQGHG